jgi:hypothetical protein
VRPERQLDLEPPFRRVERVAEQLAKLVDPVADGLRVDVELGGNRRRVRSSRSRSLGAKRSIGASRFATSSRASSSS